ncbi:type II toxin-antitoxin system prevent-host-death family antitoxin [Streptomyces sp. GESEQ-4]|uniref:type II toxin-antitoxin system prevent-host-death family antitoxin n=1 Tax=Streptomyces sp. GESEQ-4 TaxID=2812655 RepID=UPI0027DDA290|nr:type II toxin-antitoxin system prevent-host-death family antitoxin [Streptomyces sp. GESEQ-4]
MTMDAGEARRDLFALIKRVNDDHTPVRISSKGGGVLRQTPGASWKRSRVTRRAQPQSPRPC